MLVYMRASSPYASKPWRQTQFPTEDRPLMAEVAVHLKRNTRTVRWMHDKAYAGGRVMVPTGLHTAGLGVEGIITTTEHIHFGSS